MPDKNKIVEHLQKELEKKISFSAEDIQKNQFLAKQNVLTAYDNIHNIWSGREFFHGLEATEDRSTEATKATKATEATSPKRGYIKAVAMFALVGALTFAGFPSHAQQNGHKRDRSKKRYVERWRTNGVPRKSNLLKKTVNTSRSDALFGDWAKIRLMEKISMPYIDLRTNMMLMWCKRLTKNNTFKEKKSLEARDVLLGANVLVSTDEDRIAAFFEHIKKDSSVFSMSDVESAIDNYVSYFKKKNVSITQEFKNEFIKNTPEQNEYRQKFVEEKRWKKAF